MDAYALVGRDTIAPRVRAALNLRSDREANNIVVAALDAIMGEITENQYRRLPPEASPLWQIRSSPQTGQDAQDSSHRQDADDRRQTQSEVDRKSTRLNSSH